MLSQECGGLLLWAAWSISAELSCWGGGRLRHPPPLAGSWEPRPVLMAGLPRLGACPFSYHWLSVGIHRPPGKGSAVLSLHTQREAKVFPAAARRELRPGFPWSHVAGLWLSHTGHTSCTPAHQHLWGPCSAPPLTRGPGTRPLQMFVQEPAMLGSSGSS